MAAPFRRIAHQRATLLQRLLGRKPVVNALADLVGRLCDAGSPREISAAEIDSLGSGYGVDIRVLFRRDLEGLYREYLLFCFTDRRLSHDELTDLEHLRALFDLDGDTVRTIQRNIARQLYLKSVDEVLADGTIDPDERSFLARLREDLAIPESVADNILDVKQRQREAREKRKKR